MAEVYKRENSPFYQARIVVAGTTHRISTKKRTRSEAQKVADEREARENQALIAAETESIGLVEAAAHFFAFKATSLRLATHANYKQSLKNIYGILGDFPLNTLNIQQIKGYIRDRMGGENPPGVAVRQDLAFLSSLFTFAMARDDRIMINPLLGWKQKDDLLPIANHRKSPLSQEQFDKLLAACTETYQRLFLWLCASTGMRSGECRGLMWKEINFTTREIYLPEERVKNGEARFVFPTDEAWQLLLHTHDTQKPRTPYVFPSQDGEGSAKSFRTSWKGICRRAGVVDVRIHDLRHTFASWALNDGMDSLMVQDLLGHKTASMTRRYAHPKKDALKREMKKFRSNTKSDTDSTKSNLLDVLVDGKDAENTET